MRPQGEAEEVGAQLGPPLLLWAPSRLVKELRAACLPELQEQYRLQYHLQCRQAAAQQADGDGAAPAPAELPPLAVRAMGGGAVAEVAPAAGTRLDMPRLLAAARQCSLLSAVVRPLAAAAAVEAAAEEATRQLSAAVARRHPLRVLSLGSAAARAPKERFLRQQLQQLGLGATPDTSQPRLWCIHWGSAQQAAGGHAVAAPQPGQPQRQGQQMPGQPMVQPPAGSTGVLLGLELAAGEPQPSTAAGRKLGPTAMLPELAAVSASLAGVHPGSVVLDPFCGSGSMLQAAAQRGAALAVGSDVDASHFAGAGGSGSGRRGGDGSSNGSVKGGPVFLQADAACLHQLLPAGVVDAVLTDIPYGYRTVAAVQPGSAEREAEAAAAEEEDWQHLVAVLLQLAEHALVPGGRLLTWLPRRDSGGSHAVPSAQQQELAEQGLRRHLRLLHFLPETRQAGYPRAIAVFERMPAGSSNACDASCRCSGSSDRQAQLLARLQAARLEGMPVFNLPDPLAQRQQPDQPAAAHQPAEAGQQAGAGADADVPAAVRQRGVKYKQVRGAAAGTAIDVWRAAWLGDCGAISEYAAAAGDVNARERQGQTALQFAAGYGREAAAALLLELGADPSAAGDRSGMAALHRAAARNHAGVLRLLLAAGADCWQRSAAGQTPLMYASQFGHAGAVQLLLDHLGTAEGQPGQQSEETSKGSGTVQASPAVTPAQPSSTASCLVSLREHLALCDASGLSALHLAAQWGMADVAERLLAAGADPNQPSACEQQLAAAHLAARWGHPHVLEVLNRHGADLRRRCGGRGWEPLQEAEEWRRPACVQLLQLLCYCRPVGNGTGGILEPTS